MTINHMNEMRKKSLLNEINLLSLIAVISLINIALQLLKSHWQWDEKNQLIVVADFSMKSYCHNQW